MANLKTRFEELIHMNWSMFVELENDKAATVDDGVLCSLIRICSDSDDIPAIKLAFDRIDGLQEIPLEIKVPKFYVRYINAKDTEPSVKGIEAPKDGSKKKTSKYDPATAKLRETLQEMRKLPMGAITTVRSYKNRIDKGREAKFDPMVKSVIVANLLKNVQRGRYRAIELVFDQIDGKLTRTITLLGGEDVYVDDYTTLIAPAHAIKDKNGVYIAENKLMTSVWIQGFAKSQKGLETLTAELEDEG